MSLYGNHLSSATFYCSVMSDYINQHGQASRKNKSHLNITWLIWPLHYSNEFLWKEKKEPITNSNGNKLTLKTVSQLLRGTDQKNAFGYKKVSFKFSKLDFSDLLHSIWYWECICCHQCKNSPSLVIFCLSVVYRTLSGRKLKYWQYKYVAT